MAFFRKRILGLYSTGLGEACQSIPPDTGTILPVSADIIPQTEVTPIQSAAPVQEASFLSKVPYWLWIAVIGGGFLFLGGRKTKLKRRRSF